MRTAIQLYTLRHLDEPLPDTITRVGETEFDGVEIAGLDDRAPADVAAALEEAGLDVMAAHVGLGVLEDDLDGTVETYRDLGCDHLVVPWTDPADLGTREGAESVAHRLADVGDRVRDHGLDFSSHNHDQEFRDVGGEPAFHVFAREAPDLTFEVDAGWVLAGGHDPAGLIREYGDRVPLVHCKDVLVDANREPGETDVFTTDAHQPVELGEGDLDLAGVLEAAREAGTEWACYEHDFPGDPVASLEHGSDLLTDLVG